MWVTVSLICLQATTRKDVSNKTDLETITLTLIYQFIQRLYNVVPSKLKYEPIDSISIHI